jgi:uncharacterized protein YeaO (DUF488 family)
LPRWADANIVEMIASRPSGAWFGHVLELWPKSRVRSFKELDANRVALDRLAEFLSAGMPFGAQDVERKNAVALAEYLFER